MKWPVTSSAVGVLVVAALGCVPAAAQYYPAPRVYVPAPHVYAPAPPPPLRRGFDVRRTDDVVRSLGLRPTSHVRMRGPLLVIDAIGQEGSPLRVSIDRYSGRVTRIVRIGRAAPRLVPMPDRRAGYDDEDVVEFDRRPAGRGPSVITRRGTVDPLNGASEAFRGSGAPQRLAARPPEPTRRAVEPQAQEPERSPAARKDNEKFPPAQGFE